MNKNITVVAMVPDNKVAFALLFKQSLDFDEDQVVMVSRTNEDGEVEVMLTYHVQLPLPRIRPNKDKPRATVKAVFGLNAFLNVARMLAIEHKAVINRPEATLEENAGRILIGNEGAGHG